MVSRATEKGLRTLEKHIRKVSNGNVQLGRDGRCVIRYERVAVYILAVPSHDLVIFKSFINFVPDPNSGMVLPLYYHLLDMNDEPETGDAYFAIVAGEEIGKEQDAISVEVKRPITDISFDEFMRCVVSVGDVSNRYMLKLANEFKAPPVP